MEDWQFGTDCDWLLSSVVLISGCALAHGWNQISIWHCRFVALIVTC